VPPFYDSVEVPERRARRRPAARPKSGLRIVPGNRKEIHADGENIATPRSDARVNESAERIRE